MRSLAVEKRLSTSNAAKIPIHGFLSGSKWGWLAIFVIALMMPLGAKAQIGGSATIQGSVTDSTGAVIMGATVTAKSLATGSVMTHTVDKDGYYVLSPLEVGDYTIIAKANGFEELIRKNIHVDGMQVLGLNLTLSVGAVDATVTVTDVPPPLETENATLGAAMENQVYQALPLEMGAAGAQDQRRATDFAALMPGVSANETKNNETDEPMVVNGNQAASEMYIDGIPVTSVAVAGDPRYIWSAFSVETIDQFQLKTSAYSAEYRGMGIENYTIKSGTNQVHGTVYDVMRNTAFDAAGFIPGHYTDQSGNTHWYTPPEHMTEYGASLGGPIWKNKVFLFANYMGYRFSSQTTPQYQSIPTNLMRQGNFTELSQAIDDPTSEYCASTSVCTRTQLNSTGYTWSGTPGQSQPTQNPGGTLNVIPTNEISPIALKMAAMLPAPTNSGVTNNYLGSYAWGLNNWSQSERLDADITSNQKISVVFAAGRQGLVGPAGSQSRNVATMPYLYAKSYRPVTKDLMFEHTYLINSSLVNQFKYAALQYKGPAINPTYGVAGWGASSFGITGLPNTQAGQGFPEVTFTTTSSPDEAAWGPQSSGLSVIDNYTLLDNMQLVKGKHSISFGGQYQWLGDNNSATGQTPALMGSSPLELTFKNSETSPFKAGSNSLGSGGFDYASYMLGAVDGGKYTDYAQISNETGTRFHPFAFYFNDDFRASSKLTINAGLRWDYLPPMHEAQNRYSYMNPNLTNPYTGTGGALEFAGYGADSSNSRSPVKTYMKNFGPRLGFAYAVDDKTVIRASIGMYYALGGGVGGVANSTQPDSALQLGYSVAPNPTSPGYALPVFYLNGATGVATTTVGPAGSTVTNDPTNVNYGGAGYTFVAPPFFDAGYATPYATNASTIDSVSSTQGYIDPKLGGRAPEFTGWSFGFQRSITKDMTATVSYVGNEAHHLVANNGSSAARGYYTNQDDPKYLTLGTCFGDKVSGLQGAGTVCGPSNTAQTLSSLGLSLPFATFNTGQNLSQMLKPFAQYSGVSDEFAAVSNSTYNSLQLSIIQRLAHGLTMMLNYTFSKSIDDAGTFRSGYAIPAAVSANGKNWAADRADRSLSTFDQRQNVTGTATYLLPFGRGHIGNGNAIVRNVAGQWEVSGIFTYVGGNPLVITQNTCKGNSTGGTCMPAFNPAFTGSVRQNGGWGSGATRTTLGSISYINPAAFEMTGTSNSNTAYQYVIGDVTRTAPYGLRGPGNYNIDASLRRTFDLWNKENVKFVFEANVFNLENHVWFGSTSSNATGSIGQSFGSGSFGTVVGQANNPRQFQFAGHVNF